MDESNGLIRQHSIERLYEIRKAALTKVAEAVNLRNEMLKFNEIWMQEVPVRLIDDILPEIDVGKATKEIDYQLWRYLLDRTRYSLFMSRKATDDFYEKLRTNPPAFVESEVTPFITNLESLYLDNYAQLSTEVYNQLIGAYYHGSNIVKKNNLRGIEKISRIRAGIQYEGWIGWQYRHWERYNVNLDDLYRVCLLLDGRLSGYGFEFRVLAESQTKHGPIVETEYFKVQGYINGNNKLTWIREDILSALNKIGSGSSSLPDVMKKRYKPEHFDGNGMTDTLVMSKYSLPKNQEEGFHRTPEQVVDYGIRFLGLKKWMKFADTSAGDGAIVKRAVQAGCEVHAFEINNDRRQALAAIHGCTVSPHADFVKYAMNGAAAEQFDRIFINPPFERQNAVAHFVASYKMLKKGGMIMAIMPMSITYKGDAAFSYFRQKFMPLAVNLPYEYSMKNCVTNASHDKIIFLKPGIFQLTDFPACLICVKKEA